MKKVIKTDKAPDAIGPYSQGIMVDKFLFISGQIAIIPETGELIKGEIELETEQILENIKAILEEADGGMENIVKTTIYLRDIGNFYTVNKIYGQFFKTEPPARATVAVSNLPKGADIEIEAIAVLD
ncbi:RidA family protein [candidate division WOR-3 bacterium]|nr:RidA family protein [candidate division WOR-3 bacterium]